ncbi:primosomal protein N' [Marivibrio halodurans]|uniref:Replication restart protein PriA n=1 Tax=Marivibrio halodurans TaxID=2039722 RepID=A0A8J7SQD2_9PROT|nr:primosomal protein N' [Marivibrio halodurans]MBP5858996.1 primosomal protein N' [Marivibrio halodurans]
MATSDDTARRASHPALFGSEERRVKVLLPLPLGGAYDYRLPPDMTARPGQFVRVPLSNREMVGVVWDPPEEEDASTVPASKLRDVEAVLNAPPLPAENRRLVEWIAAYVLSPPGAVLRMAMSVPSALDPPPTRTAYVLSDTPPEVRTTPARARVIERAREGMALPAADLAREAGVTPGVVRGLADAGVLVPVQVRERADWPDPDSERAGPALSEAQRAAADSVVAKARAGGFSVTLIDGVTGSGKTEVYFEAIAAALRAGRQVLVLLPEIALGAQWLERFTKRFGVAPAEWHSDLTAAQRRATWRGVAEGRVRVLVGARSGLHLPFPDLGLIVIDEEHDQSFKQEDGVIYHARDMAVVRAHIGDFPILLASATPSLETVTNCESGRYARLVLPERHGGADLPTIEMVDLRRHPPPRQSWIAPPLREALEQCLARGEQALLFLNRRGYAPLTLCRACGHRLECPNCNAWLVEHRFSRRLECHHCGHWIPMPEECPECGAADQMAACGPGVERLAEEAAALLPDARMELATSDTLMGPLAAAAFVDRMATGETNLVIGTQIVAKGYHFPLLTLVGVVDADLGLEGGDLRASERTFQLLSQVAGRAGRAGHKGRVLLQTANPDARVLSAIAAGDRDGFLAAEAEARKAGGWPPFGRLAALIVSGPEERPVEETARALARAAPVADGVRVLGPAPPPLALLRGRFRRRLLLKADRAISVQKALRDWIGHVKVPNQVRLHVDVDPYNFM